jgi:excinuclease ABC subunit B
MFKLKSSFKPTGDQPQAIDQLVKGLRSQKDSQVLLGVTGSGKTFAVANVIQEIQKPTLVVSHNKTLAAQLYQEFRDFFPENAVEYFVSYYDYYQPESYIPSTDTYIEKDADINEQIDKLRLSATTSLMTRKDVIVIASVSCIYNLGSPAVYSQAAVEVGKGMKLRQMDLLKRLSQLSYTRADWDFKRGTYRVSGDVVDVFPSYLDYAVRLEFLGDKLLDIGYFNSLTGKEVTPERLYNPNFVSIYPAKHYITVEDTRGPALAQIRKDLAKRTGELKKEGKELEAYRLQQKTNYDLEMIQEIGYCKGIENYSRYFDGRKPGQPPYTLMDFFPKDHLLVVDESHITVPQIGGMYKGDQSRKNTLIEYGFRLPSALDNRPLDFDEFAGKLNQTIYASATPKEWELKKSNGEIAELLIRPTGIIDPEITIIPTKGQVEDLYEKILERVERRERTLVTTLTKRMAEELADFLKEKGIKVTYLHSDIDTLERTSILDDLRKGNYDVLVGINLLREGLDLPEVSLVAILDADKEGFLRSDTSLIQTMGRASRHMLGEVVMYADRVTGSMQRAIDEVKRRRDIQIAYNNKHGVTPRQIVKPIREKLIDELVEESSKSKRAKIKLKDTDYKQLPPRELKKEIKTLEKQMKFEAEMLNFEVAAALRDQVRRLKKLVE